MSKHDSHDTAALLQRLAAQAGAPARDARAFPLGLAAASVAALVAALLVVAGVYGLRPDLATLPGSGMFQFKVAAMALLGIGAIWLVHRCGTPGQRPRAWLALLPAALVLLGGIALDRSGLALSGARAVSVPLCLLAIVSEALPGLALLLAALRHGIPTRPAQAGAAAGLLSGALGALAYTLSCINDGAAFVALWYPAAIALTSALGAALGAKLLRW